MSVTDIKTSGLPAKRPRRAFYPDSDGKPMAETDKHADQMTYHKEALRDFFASRSDVYVSGNNFVYWEEGNPQARVSPDCYVVFGVPQRQRNFYKSWEEGGYLPSVVFEFTSKKTKKEDIEDKMALYERLGIFEYFLFDPYGDYLDPQFQGYRLDYQKRYEPIPLTNGRMHSGPLGLDMQVENGDFLRLIDPQTGTSLPTREELHRQAALEAEARRNAEDEIVRLRAELDALRQPRSGPEDDGRNV